MILTAKNKFVKNKKGVTKELLLLLAVTTVALPKTQQHKFQTQVSRSYKFSIGLHNIFYVSVQNDH